MIQVAEIDALVDGAQRAADLTRAGSRASHEVEMALISLRNLRREVEQSPPAPVEPPRLRLVSAGPLAPIDDPAFDV